MNFDALRRRRATYQRSKTLGSLPLHLIHQPPQGPHERRSTGGRDSDEGRGTIAEELSLLSPIDDDSPVHVRASSETLRPAGLDAPPYPTSGTLSPAGDGPVFRPSTSPRRRPSPSDFALAHAAMTGGQGDGGGAATKRSSLERSRSISALLFTKVKDRIVEKMFQTATEGPQLAAIVQERRQRAADEYEARLQTSALLKGGHRKDMQLGFSSGGGGSGGLHVDDKLPFSGGGNVGSSSRRVRGSLGSSPIKELPITEEGSASEESETHERIHMARVAFRRRSISQDAAQMGMLLLQPGGVGGGSQGKPRTSGSQNLTVSAGGGSQNFEGIVCSNDDFQAIVKMGQLAMQIGGGQKPRLLNSRAQSFNQGSSSSTSSSPYAAHTTTKQQTGGDSQPPPSSHDTDPNSNIPPTDEESEETESTKTQPSRASPTTTVTTSHPSLTDSSHKRTGSQSSTATTESTNTTTVVTATTTAMASEVRRQSQGCDPGSPTMTMTTTTLATVPEIEYDENGQTWDVYGAEFDPEILGDAIQLHLKRLIERNFFDIQQMSSSGQENPPPPGLSAPELAPTPRCRNDEVVKIDRKRSYRPEVKKRRDGGGGENDDTTNSIFRYLCIFTKRRHASDGTV